MIWRPRLMAEDTYRDFVLDQLAPLAGALECRKMFGGCGLSLGGSFFGILYRGRLYFRADPASRAEYEKRGMRPFRPNARQTLRSYSKSRWTSSRTPTSWSCGHGGRRGRRRIE